MIRFTNIIKINKINKIALIFLAFYMGCAKTNSNEVELLLNRFQAYVESIRKEDSIFLSQGKQFSITDSLFIDVPVPNGVKTVYIPDTTSRISIALPLGRGGSVFYECILKRYNSFVDSIETMLPKMNENQKSLFQKLQKEFPKH